ncbi:hypothetical protein AcV5_010551 [Taiwanofungus camphoratus]|nr:hypothetical protein AcV5_010551 [Antrodia cinnamomea]
MAPSFTPTSHPTDSHSTAGDSQVTGTPSTGTSSSRMSGGTSSGRPAPYSAPDVWGSQTQAQVEALRLARGASFEMETTFVPSPPPSVAAEAFMPTQPFMPTPTPKGGPALHVLAIPESTMYATAPKVQVFQGTCSSQDETSDSLLVAIRESLQHISYTLHVDRDAYERIIRRDVNKYHAEAYGLEWRDTAQAALQVASQMVTLIGAEHIMDLNGIGHLATRVRELTDFRAELESTIAEQQRTIGEMLAALTLVLPKPSDQWFEGARITLGAIATSTTNDSGKLIQAVATNTSTL